MTFGEVMACYASEASPTKQGERREVIRLDKLKRDYIAAKRVGDRAAPDFFDWRDARLREVFPASVKRKMNLMLSVLTRAGRD